jgi:endoglycosylceramidase
MYRGTGDGRVYVFHGLDTENSSPPWYLRTLDQQQIDLMKSWGLNMIRVGFQWHMVEPETGHYNETYIESLVDYISLLNGSGIHVILDMHQDCWSPLYCHSHGIPSEYAQAYNTSDYRPGGPKAYPEPVAKPQYGPDGQITNCADVGKFVFGWASCYFTYSIGAAAQRLYDNDRGILDRFGEFWQLIASRVKYLPNVLGYEVINEPWLGDVPLTLGELDPIINPDHWDLWLPKVADRKNVAKMYRVLHEYIRQVDNDSIIFFEPATGGNFLDGWPVGFEEGPGGVAYKNRQALSYHVYCLVVDKTEPNDFFQYLLETLSIEACNALDDVLYDVRRDDTSRLNLAGFLTEFGNAGKGLAAKDVIDFATAKMDEFFHGWSYWYLTPDPSVRNSTEIMALARPFPHKIAGTPSYLNFDPKSKNFTLVYTPCTTGPCSKLPTEIFTSLNYAYGGIEFGYAVETNSKASVTLDNEAQMMYVTVAAVESQNDSVKLTLFRK